MLTKEQFIRNGHEEDIEVCNQIAKENNLLAWAGPSLKQWNTRDNTRFFVAESIPNEGEVLGFIMTMNVLDSAELLVVCVKDGYKNKGIGKQLIEHAAKKLKNQGVESILLEVNVNNAPAKALYRALDFKEIATRKNYYDGKHDAVVMKKVL